jgi:DNA repair protein RadC
MSDNNSIKNWAKDDRPREKLIEKGAASLSDSELIALLISTGTKELSAVDLSRKLLDSADNSIQKLGTFSIADLKKIKGIGQAKAVTIAAALELGKRRQAEPAHTKPIVSSSRNAFEILQPKIGDLKHEEFWVVCSRKISSGGTHQTVVDPKMIMKVALDESASSIILCHNHPSGNLKPSPEDEKLTKRIQNAAALFDVKLLDHLIIAGNKYLSFADENLL